MTDIHDIKPLMAAPFPWLVFFLVTAFIIWLAYKIRQRLLQMKKNNTPPLPVSPPKPPFDYKSHTIKELKVLSANTDLLYSQQKESYIYALVSYWIRFYLEHHTKHAALTMTKKEVQEKITKSFDPYLAQCYRIEFAKEHSTAEETKQFINSIIEEIIHGV